MFSALVSCLWAGFYDADSVRRIDLYFAEAHWDEILDSLFARGQEERLLGTAVINGVRFESVGVRYKGHSSYNPSRPKNPLNIKLDCVKPDQLIEGHGTLRLANVYKDPSFVREVLSYEIARKYLPASRAGYINVYVNDTLIGLYTNCEDIDKLFMRRNFCCDENPRFKGQMIDGVPLCGWKYYGTDTLPYKQYFERESDSGRQDWQELIQLFDTLNNFPEAIEEVLNLDRHLWMLAFDILLVNLDAPVNMPQNHYLYQDLAGRFNPIIWDLNECFGAFRDFVGAGQLTLAQMQRLPPFLRANDLEYPICSRIFCNPRYRRQLVAHMKTMIAENITNNWYLQRAYELQNLIDAHVLADRNKFYTYNDFLNNVTRTAGSGPLAIVGLTELMNTRSSWLMSQPEFQATAPTVIAFAPEPPAPAPNANVMFRVRVDDADSVFLNYRQKTATRFCRLAMYDDGAHGDSAAGDGIYGVGVRLGAGTVDYYFYAENNAAGTFLPARAEHQCFTLPVAGSIVINEFMGINDHTVPDPNGEYDDWIEIYNNTSRSISLDDYLLSNDSNYPAKWSFPDVRIPANGYLIVWADDEPNQPGIHANFRLAGSNGTLLLSDPDGILLDQVVYGQQTPDVSFGRYPNGSGTFTFMPATWGAENICFSSVRQEPVAVSQPLFLHAAPNPFAERTRLCYSLTKPSRVSLIVYDALGRRAAVVFQGVQGPGEHLTEFVPPRSVSGTGIWFACLRVGSDSKTDVIERIKLVGTR